MEYSTEHRAFKETLTFNEVTSYSGKNMLFTWDVPMVFIDKDGVRHNIKAMDMSFEPNVEFILKEQ